MVENNPDAGGNVPVGSGEGTVTKKLNAYSLESSDSVKVCTLWDTAGIEVGSSSLYKDGAMALLLKGHFPKKTDLTAKLDDRTPGYRQNPTEEERIHGVIMCIAASDVSDDSYTKAIKDFTHIVRDRDIPHILVITKADEYDPDLLDGGVCQDDDDDDDGEKVPLDMRHVYRSIAIRELMDKATETGFSKDDMAPLANKTEQDMEGIAAPKACLLMRALVKITTKAGAYRRQVAVDATDLPAPPPPPASQAPPSDIASFVNVTRANSVASSSRPGGRKTMTEALIMICTELGVSKPPDVDLKSALKEAQEALGEDPVGNLQAQVQALVNLLGLDVPGWESAAN